MTSDTSAEFPPIPVLNLKAQHEKLRPEILGALEDVYDSMAYIQGRHAGAFEEQFAAAHGVKYAAGCSNGTTALSLALEAAGVGPGDEIITVAYTFIATAESILHLGATPIFVDIEPGTYNIDPNLVRQAITSRTKAIVPVHLYGTPCDMGALQDIAGAHDLLMIEDCAQAHLAKYGGKAVGTFGQVGSFSFYPGKNLGACGDAGCVVSEDADTIARVKKLLDHGRETKYLHDIVGYNRRMDAMQAAILGVKLRYLEEWTTRRRENAAIYDSVLKPAGFQVIEPPDNVDPVYHLYVIQVSNRDETTEALKANNIGFGVHYPTPLHLQPSLTHLGYRRGSLPVTENVSDRVISLPMCAELNRIEIERVCDVILKFARP
jgi:dTDP-4-amino-4,6-dideoxygalactose transaminase